VIEPEFDKHGYPTEATLHRIETWPISGTEDMIALLGFVRVAWRYEDWGFRVAKRWRRPSKGMAPRLRYAISTGGWSGNEDIISALQGNGMFWGLTWRSSRRGGHYAFEVPRMAKR
jgi:hypothetical protein